MRTLCNNNYAAIKTSKQQTKKQNESHEGNKIKQ